MTFKIHLLFPGAKELAHCCTHVLMCDGRTGIKWCLSFFTGIMTFNCTLTHMVLNLSEENTYLHFLSFLNTKSAQVAEILPHDWLGPFCPALSIPMLLMTWRLKEPGHQQQWYWHIPEYYGYPTKWCIRISKLQYMTWWYSISACNVMPINCWADQSHQLWQMSPMTTRHVGFMPWYQWNPIHNHVYAPVQGVMIVNGWGMWLRYGLSQQHQ